MKNVRNIICLIFLGVLLFFVAGCGKQISGINNADYAIVSFTIDPSAETYKFEGDDVQKIISLIKPETWRKGRMTLELSPVEHIYFNQNDTRYVVGILDVENNNVMFKVYSATNGKWNSDSCYYKTDDVGYKELIDALKEMCCIQKNITIDACSTLGRVNITPKYTIVILESLHLRKQPAGLKLTSMSGEQTHC